MLEGVPDRKAEIRDIAELLLQAVEAGTSLTGAPPPPPQHIARRPERAISTRETPIASRTGVPDRKAEIRDIAELLLQAVEAGR
jgi:Trm5-related predicted tRNA methylase